MNGYDRTAGEIQPEYFEFAEESFSPMNEYTEQESPNYRKRTCTCEDPTNCRCGKRNQSGRWIRRGNRIVIINP